MLLRCIGALAVSGTLLSPALGAERASESAVLAGVDVLAGDDALVKIALPPDVDGLRDVRLARHDALTGQLLKQVDDVHGCDLDWEESLTGRGVTGGEQVTFFLGNNLPVAPYVAVQRRTGSNGSWEPLGAPFWVVTQPVSRIAPCQSARMSLDQQPALAEARSRAERATVKLVTDDGRRGQGLVINPWGHLVTASALVEGADFLRVTFAPGALGVDSGETGVTYVPVAQRLAPELAQEHGGGFPDGAHRGDQLAIWVPVEGESTPAFFPVFAPLADRKRVEAASLRFQHRGVLYGRRFESGETARLKPVTQMGYRIPTYEEADVEGAHLAFEGGLGKADQGAAIYDHAGVVWGVALDGQRAAWATHVVDRYVAWYRAGVFPDLVARTRDGGK